MAILISALSSAFGDTSLAATDGAAIYATQCVRCHGPHGEGVADKYAEPLAGDKSAAELSRLIEETMPEDDPGSCTGKEAAAVAKYVFDSFYSSVARQKDIPQHVEFSRLTVTQYQNSVADLMASFAPRGDVQTQRGLSAVYTDNNDKIEKRVSFERTDAAIDFDFGKSTHIPEKLLPKNFAIIWTGALYAPETGTYNFQIETKNGVRFWLNDPEKPLLDEVVVSKDNKGWPASAFLLQGRWYFFRVMLSKKDLDDSTAIRVKWKRPFGAEEVIPARNFAPSELKKLYVVETPFPPDDRIAGYERGTEVSPEWATATTQAAVEIAEKLIVNLDQFVGGKAEERSTDVHKFCAEFVSRAFRHPLSKDELEFFVDRQLSAEESIRDGVKRVIILALKSPRFLCRETASDGWDDFDVASWLSFGLWDSIPDQRLVEAAVRGELHAREQISAQVTRMLGDVRARTKMRSFLHDWLNVERIQQVAKDKSLFPNFSELILTDLRTSLDLSLDDAVWDQSRRADFRRLLLDESVYLNGRLAEFYGVELPHDADFHRTSINLGAAAGILTHPYLMTGFAHEQATSPILRGVFLARNVFGRTLRPPQNAVALDPVSSRPGLNTRERVEQQTSNESCMACHRMINGLGFTLENFDAVGKYRDAELSRPLNVDGSYVSRLGNPASFSGAKQLSEFVASSTEAQDAFLERMFRFFTKHPVQILGNDELPKLHESFVDRDFSIVAAISDIITDSAVEMRKFQPSDSTTTATAATESEK